MCAYDHYSISTAANYHCQPIYSQYLGQGWWQNTAQGGEAAQVVVHVEAWVLSCFSSRIAVGAGVRGAGA